MTAYTCTVGVALERPPAIHEYRRYVIEARTALEARELACQIAACTCVMPVHATWPKETP